MLLGLAFKKTTFTFKHSMSFCCNFWGMKLKAMSCKFLFCKIAFFFRARQDKCIPDPPLFPLFFHFSGSQKPTTFMRSIFGRGNGHQKTGFAVVYP